MLLGNYILKGFGFLLLSIKRLIFPNEQIVGKYYGYYLHKDSRDASVDLKESTWDISPDLKKNNYNIKIYHEIINKNKLLTCINNKKYKMKTKKRMSYRGKMWKEDNHLLLSLKGQTYTETIFERRLQGTKVDGYPIIGISLAINPKKKIRANVSVLSKKRLTQEDVIKYIKEYKGIAEASTYNLKVED
jgi:hypothetical protein